MNDDERKAILRAVGVGALVFTAVMAFGAPRWMGGDGSESRLVGTAAPDFDAEIVAGEGAGDRITLSTLRGHVVMLDFWASWCPPCRESIPILGRVAARHASSGLLSFAVNVEGDQPNERIAAAHRALHVMIPTVVDRTYGAQSQLDVQVLPTLVLVDREGVIRHLHVGVPDEDQLDGWIDALVR